MPNLEPVWLDVKNRPNEKLWKKISWKMTSQVFNQMLAKKKEAQDSIIPIRNLIWTQLWAQLHEQT